MRENLGKPLSKDQMADLIASRRRSPRHRTGEEFLKGPIPLAWLEAAARLPGNALAVGIAVWFKAGVAKSGRVKVSNALVGKFGVRRHSKYAALRVLESAGLISVHGRSGRSPVVTLQEKRPD